MIRNRSFIGAFRHLSLRRKIHLLNLVVISVSISLLVIGLNRIALNQVVDRTVNSSDQKLHQIMNTLTTLMNGIEDYSKLAIINQTSQAVLSLDRPRSEDDVLDELEAVKLMYVSLTSMVESNPIIDSVIVQSSFGKIYASSKLSHVTEQSLAQFPTDELDRRRGAPVWIETYASPFQPYGQVPNLMTVGRRIISVDRGVPLGYLYVNIEERELAKLYREDEPGLSSTILIVNGQGKIISASDPALIYGRVNEEPYADWVMSHSQGGKIFTRGGRDDLVVTRSMGKLDWKAIYIVPISDLMKDQWKMTAFLIGFGVAGLLFAYLLSLFVAHWISRPIHKLSSAMTAVGMGNLNARAPIHTRDEVGQLALRFNQMVVRIQELLDAVNREEKQKRNLELRLLYAQIKPHFLYNTLEMIRSMALMANERDIAKVVKALGDFYRFSLSRGQDTISVRQEQRHLESYLFIQRMRYPHIRYTIEFEAEMEHCVIPAMLLQPLVENSVYHGLRDKREDGYCEITGIIRHGESGSFLRFVVKDNGKGMTPEQLERLRSAAMDEREGTSFGIRNVEERIRLRFGEAGRLSIRSRPGEGVEVTVELPVVPEESAG
jgi:two-component system sensor histidine kinase YesM